MKYIILKSFKQMEYKYIDLSYLKEASSDNKFLKKILTVFDEEYNELRNSILTGIKEKTHDDLKKTLHKAKSSVLVTSIPGGREIIINAEKEFINGCCNNNQIKLVNSFIQLCDKAIIEFNHAAENI